MIAAADQCFFCSRALPPGAEMKGGVPYFYRNDTEIDRPVCPECAAVHLRPDENGEMERRIL